MEQIKNGFGAIISKFIISDLKNFNLVNFIRRKNAKRGQLFFVNVILGIIFWDRDKKILSQ